MFVYTPRLPACRYTNSLSVAQPPNPHPWRINSSEFTTHGTKGKSPLPILESENLPPILRTRERSVRTTNKSRMFCFRLSESDYLRIHSRAEKSKLSMSAFILSMALGKEIIIIEGLENSIAELKAIGRNLNQLTTLCNMGKIQALELAEIKRQFGTVVESITGLKAG